MQLRLSMALQTAIACDELQRRSAGTQWRAAFAALLGSQRRCTPAQTG